MARQRSHRTSAFAAAAVAVLGAVVATTGCGGGNDVRSTRHGESRAGKVLAEFGHRTCCGEIDSSGASPVAIQDDGKIVAGGSVALSRLFPGLALIRFDTDGRVDASFGSHGRVVFGAKGASDAHSMAIQEDGAIVTAGSEGDWHGSWGYFVARFRPDGRLEPSFGNRGVRHAPSSLAWRPVVCLRCPD